MKKVTLVFTDGETTHNASTMLDAYEIILDVYNRQLGDSFIGARIGGSKEYASEHFARIYVREVTPVKEYLEHAVLSNFSNEQIVDDIKWLKSRKLIRTPSDWDGKSVLSSWKEFMTEFSDGYDEFLRKLFTKREAMPNSVKPR